MRTITVTDWTDLKISCPNSSELNTEGVIEGCQYCLEFIELSSSNLDDVESSLLKKPEDLHVYGEALCAIDRAIELAISVMRNGEIAAIELNIAGKYVYNNKTCDNFLINSHIRLNVTEAGKNVLDSSPEDKISMSLKYKSFGAEVIQRKNVADSNITSFLCFSRAIQWLLVAEFDELNNDQKERINILKLQCYNNISQYHLKVNQYLLAITATSKVLAQEPNNVKALYRRAVANTNFQEYDTAKEDLINALTVDPTNKVIKKQLNEVNKKIKAIDMKYANAMSKFLS